MPEERASTCFASRNSAIRSLELGRARPARQPAGADRVGGGGDLLLADRRAAGSARWVVSRVPHRRDEAYAFRGARGALERLLAAVPTASSAPARSAPRRSGRTRGPAPGRSGRRATPSSASAASRPSTSTQRPRRDEEDGRRRRRRRDFVVLKHGRRFAERGVEREPVQVDPDRGLDELGVVAAAEPRRDLHHLGAGRADPELRVRRPVRGSRAPRRRRARPRSRARARDEGQTCASATPNAGGSAVTRSVTRAARNSPSAEKATTVTSGPGTSSSTRQPRRARERRARPRPPPAAPPGRARARARSGPGGRSP